ncbi:MAG: hypothetical protein ACYC4L_15810 [Chloroflexota bacterium]
MRVYAIAAAVTLVAFIALLVYALTASLLDTTILAMLIALVGLLLILVLLILFNVLSRPLFLRMVTLRTVRQRLASNPGYTVETAVAELLRLNLRRDAIALYRERQRVSLQEARDAVEAIARRQSQPRQ